MPCTETLSCCCSYPITADWLNHAGRQLDHIELPFEIYKVAKYVQGEFPDFSAAALEGMAQQRQLMSIMWHEGLLECTPNSLNLNDKGGDHFDQEEGFELLSRLQTPTSCNACGGEARHWCGKCHTVKYCGRECQLRDWQVLN
jgi:MYND finger